MSQKLLRFALFGNEYQSHKSAAIRNIFSYLNAHGAEICIDRPYYDFLSQQSGLDLSGVSVFEGCNFDVDFAVSLGGDGTFLRAAARVALRGTPLIGVNMGRLGFLADVLPTEVDEAFDCIYGGRYRIEDHSALCVETEGASIGGNPVALNDIAVLKRDNASMITIRASIDGEYLVTYQADGLIVATPTGSTAYSLSNGGPIIVPQTDIVCLTPVAPHSLNVRPIVIRDNCRIELEVESRSHNFLIAVDGRSEKLREGTRVIISKAPQPIHIVKRPGHRFFATLRSKMMWGADQRQ